MGCLFFCFFAGIFRLWWNMYTKGGGLVLLQAKSSSGEYITLALLTKKEIDRRRGDTFFCPVCNNKVIMKAGTTVIPHFAHKSGAACETMHGGEGIYHEQGKLLLYQWLLQQGLNVTLEAYIPEINQRPDLLVNINGKQIAIEYQCAKIPKSQIDKRNNGYLDMHITPIWILGANHFKRIGEQIFHTSTFTLQFLHQFHNEFATTLYYLCPYEKKLVTLQNIHPIRGNRMMAVFRQLYLQHATFLHLFDNTSFTPEQLYLPWMKEKRNFRLRPRNQLYGRELKWHRWLYDNQLWIERLPSIIYLPIANQLHMKTPLWDWQSRLWFQILHRIPIGGTFTLAACERFIRQDKLPRRTYSLLLSADSPILSYLQLIEQAGMIEMTNPGQYKKIAPMTSYTNVEQAIIEDQKLMKKLVAVHNQNTSIFGS